MLAAIKTPLAEPTPDTIDESVRKERLSTPQGRSYNRPSLFVTILCIVLVALALRPAIVSVGPLLPAIIQTFSLSHTQASLLTAIPTLLMGLMALPAPWLARQFGRDRVVVVALVVLMLGTGLRAYVGSVVALFLATIGIGAGIAVAGALLAGFIKASHPAKVAFLMSIYATALALGSTVAAALTGPVASTAGGWRPGASVWVLPAIVAVVAWIYVDRQRFSTEPTNHFGRRYTMPVRNRTAWLIALFFASNNILFYAYISWVAPMYVEYGRSASMSGLILACFTLAFMIANPVFGLLSRSEDRRIALAVTSTTALIGTTAIALAPNAMPFLAVPIVAFGIGGAFTLGMTLPLDNADSAEEANAWNAFVLLFSYTLAAAGPLLMGYLRDTTGGFQASQWLMVGVSALMLSLTPCLQPYRQRKSHLRQAMPTHSCEAIL